MDIIMMAVKLLGGLAMFLYGMEIMGDGLKQGSGTALKNVLGKLTHNVVLGVLTGALVTAVIQSSTATIVLTVGLIGAGILNLKQAVSIVMGANIGTTVTAQIIRLMDIESGSGSILAFFKPDFLAPVALIIGIILIMFIKKESLKNVGLIAMGFGILFIGLISMTDAVEPLSSSPAFANILSYFSNMPIVGIFTGLVLTVIVQSSSAMVGILQALSSTGAMTFELVYPIIMGINLGTCVTTAMVLGTENLLIGMIKKPEKVHQLMEVIVENNNRLIKRLVEMGVGIGFPDPVSSTSLISIKQYRKFSLPYFKQNVDYVKKLGGGCGLHICGTSRALWDDIAETGIGAFSLDNVEDLEEAKRVLGHKMGIQGNVPPVEVMKLGTPHDVLRSARECIRKGWDSPNGFTLTSGCQMPANTPEANMQALMDAARIFGRYPLNADNFADI